MTIQPKGIRLTICYLLLCFLLSFLLIGCQGEQQNEESFQQETNGISWISNFSEEDFVDQGDSFQSSLMAMLKIFDQQETSASLAEMRGHPSVGTSFLNISRKLAEETGMYFTFIELTFDAAKEEIDQDHPFISKRSVRGYIDDYVLFVGFDPGTNSLVGYSILSNSPLQVNRQEWEKDYQFLQLNLSLIVADEENSIRLREESSQHYWLQMAVEAILDLEPAKLEQAIAKIDELAVTVRRADYLRAYHQIFIKRELTPETEDFLDRVYEAGPTVSHAIEWKFLKLWTLGEDEEALTYLRQLERDQRFASAFLESLYVFVDIYTDLGEMETLQTIQEIILMKEANPEYLGLPNH